MKNVRHKKKKVYFCYNSVSFVVACVLVLRCCECVCCMGVLGLR